MVAKPGSRPPERTFSIRFLRRLLVYLRLDQRGLRASTSGAY